MGLPGEAPTTEFPAAAANGGSPDAPPLAVAPDAMTPLERLAARHAEVEGEGHVDIPIPGFRGQLVCRYVVIPWEKERQITQRAAAMPVEDTRRELNAWADELIAGCDQFVRDDQGALAPAHPDVPVRYGERLAKSLGYDAKNAREALFGLFRKGVGERAEYVLAAHHDRYINWLRGARAEAEAEFAGE